MKHLVEVSTGKIVYRAPSAIPVPGKDADIASGALVWVGELPADVALEDAVYDPITKTLKEDSAKKSAKDARRALFADLTKIKDADTRAVIQAILVEMKLLQ